MYENIDELLAQACERMSEPEHITRALARDIELPHGAGTGVLITLDNGLDHTKPNTLGPWDLRAINETYDQVLARDDVAAIMVTGKPFILAAGANLKQIADVDSLDTARLLGKIGHGVLGKMHTSTVPTFGLINGLSLGGGTEVTLNCHYRTISAACPAIAFPEVFLGILPGWGGATLLPKLVGPAKAVEVIIGNALNQNKVLSGPAAHALGLADALFEGADFLERSIDWVARVVTGDVVVERARVKDASWPQEEWDAALAAGKKATLAKTGGIAPAAGRCLEVMGQSQSLSIEEGFALEDEALAQLVMTEDFRAGLYAFDLVQRKAKRPSGAPDKELARKVTKVGVVGAGLMASQLALLFIRRLGVPVVMSDLDQERVDRGVGYVHGEIDKLVAKGRATEAKANQLRGLVSGTTDQADFADCDFVIEAVFEEMGVKQKVFAGLEQHVSPECVLATNTSSLSITEMASQLEHPERVVGFHFFNPVAVLPLLELVRGEKTDDATLATAFATAKRLKKNAVLVSDAPAFVVNRVLTRLLAEVNRCVDEGTPVEVADAALAPMGLPMPPFVLMELVGPAIALHVNETLNRAFGDRFPVSPSLEALVKAGRKSVYDRDEKGKPFVADETRALLVQGDSPVEPEEILERCRKALAEEIGLMLSEGVVAGPPEIDLCMILGAGWPFHLGGITPYLDRTGTSEATVGQRFLPLGAASLPA